MISACSYSAHYLESPLNTAAKTDFQEIKIYAGDLEQEYKVIGSLTVDTPGDIDIATRFIKKKAALLGADAIIHVEINKLSTNTGRTGMSGVAVRILKNNN